MGELCYQVFLNKMTPSLNHLQIIDAKPKRPGWRRSGEVPSSVFSVPWSTALIDASFSVAVGWKSPEPPSLGSSTVGRAGGRSGRDAQQ